MKQISIEKSYYSSLLNDNSFNSRYCYVYFLKEKSRRFQLFKSFILIYKHNIKEKKTDCDKEFCNCKVLKIIYFRKILNIKHNFKRNLIT